MEPRDSFFELIQPNHLYFAAMIFGIITFMQVSMIYLFLYQRKRGFRKQTAVINILDEWIGEAIIATETEYLHTHVTPELIDYFEQEDMRQLAIDRLMETKKNLTGASANNIIKLYEQLGLKTDSMKKLNSSTWHIKAKGIYELYTMNQEDCKDEIKKYTNTENRYVRTEAQTAILGFEGFDGLKFLDNLQYIINEWQQVKLLEQLQTLDTGNMDNMPQWLQSENRYVVHFALKLADIYLQMEVHDEVAACLEHENEKVRYQAIKTLGRIANEQTNEILKKQYGQETEGNKWKILRQLSTIGTEGDMEFLLSVIATTEGRLRLEATRALASCCPDEWQQLISAYDKETGMPTIIEQVKYEQAA